jgi:uncharacterized protein YuzE
MNEYRKSLKIRQDPAADAAYIQLATTIGPGGVEHTYNCDITEVGDMINLDFDHAGRLVGIEVLDASLRLPPDLFTRG